MARSQDEIAARIREVRAADDDLFGFRTEVLAEYLDREHFREFAKPDADLSDWAAPESLAAAAEQGASYLAFAFGKALDHRGLSAARSVEKLAECAWLQGRDDVVAAMENAGYAQYGVPKLLVYAAAFDLPVPEDEALARMGRGEECDPDGCEAGCGT